MSETSDETKTPLPELLAEASIHLDASATSRDDAIRQAGQALLDVGAIDESYLDAMLERENSVSTYMGEGVAIPHATLAGKAAVRRDALCFLRFPDGVDWDGETVTVCIGIAAVGDGHLDILAELAQILLDPERAAALREATTPDRVIAMLTPAEEEDPSAPAPSPRGER